MTVCIAAACRYVVDEQDRAMIVAASDRMITAGDIQFQPPVTKIYQLTNSIFALTAGDASANAEILDHSLLAIRRRLANDMSWIRVEEVATMVSVEVGEYRKRLNERTVLAPFGLTFQTFISRQRDMSDAWANRITNQIFGTESGTNLIIAGVDDTGQGAHIWIVDGTGKTSCNDAVGFAAIGFGQWHAESQFMFAGHASWKPLPETVLLTYTAKRRAEVAPGVGAETDMCVVSGLGKFNRTPPELVERFKQLYDTMQGAQNQAATAANQAIADEFASALQHAQRTQEEQGAQAQPPQTPENPEAAVDTEPAPAETPPPPEETPPAA